MSTRSCWSLRLERPQLTAPCAVHPDRDGDGVIDVLDDAQDVIDALNAKARHSKRRHAFRLTRMEGGLGFAEAVS